jgi:hypothetical protein
MPPTTKREKAESPPVGFGWKYVLYVSGPAGVVVLYDQNREGSKGK